MSRLAVILPNKMVAGAQTRAPYPLGWPMVALPGGRIYEFANRRYPRETDSMPSLFKPLLTPPARTAFKRNGG